MVFSSSGVAHEQFLMLEICPIFLRLKIVRA